MKKDDVLRLPDCALEDLDEQNAARKHFGMTPIVLKIRNCMKCKRKFESLGNRLCGTCIEEPGAVLSGYDAV